MRDFKINIYIYTHIKQGWRVGVMEGVEIKP